MSTQTNQTATNQTAKLFWLFPFNAFNEKSIKKIKIILGVLSFIIILFNVFIYKQALDYSIVLATSDAFSELNIEDHFVFVVIFFAAAYLALYLIVGLWCERYYFFYLALSKVNADHLLEEFYGLKESDKYYRSQSLLVDIAKEDIENNGYFSASGYQKIKDELTKFNEWEKYDLKQEEKKATIEKKYPKLFSSS